MTTRQTVTIQGPEDRQRIATWARNVDEGTIVEFRKKTRSHEQNAKLHAMLGEVADQVVWYGQKLKVEDWKNMFSASLRKAQVVPGIDPGTVVPLGIHTSTMTIDEMSNMIELIYAFGAQPEHLVIFKDPNNESSDAPPPPASVDGDAAPPASLEPPAQNPSLSVGGSSNPKWNYDGHDLKYLREFAEKGLREARRSPAKSPAALQFVDAMYPQYAARLVTSDAVSTLEKMRAAIDLVIEGERNADRIDAWFNADLLFCKPVDLMTGDRADG